MNLKILADGEPIGRVKRFTWGTDLEGYAAGFLTTETALDIGTRYATLRVGNRVFTNCELTTERGTIDHQSEVYEYTWVGEYDPQVA